MIARVGFGQARRGGRVFLVRPSSASPFSELRAAARELYSERPLRFSDACQTQSPPAPRQLLILARSISRLFAATRPFVLFRRMIDAMQILFVSAIY